MSFSTDVRSYADAILEQGKHAFETAQSRLDGAVPEPAKSEIVADALALLGAIDAAIEALTKRISAVPQSGDGRLEALRHELARTRAAVEEFTTHLPENTAQLSDKAQHAATGYAGKASQYAGQASDTAGKAVDALKARSAHFISASTSGEGREQLRDEVRQTLVQSLTTLRQLRDGYAKRGERAYVHLRHDPRLMAVLGVPAEPKPSASNGHEPRQSQASRASTADQSTGTESTSTASKRTASTAAGSKSTASKAAGSNPTASKAAKPASAPKRTTRTTPRKASSGADE